MTRRFGTAALAIIAVLATSVPLLAQAVLMAVLALLPGIIAGTAVAFLVNLSMMPVLGHPVSFTVHPALMVGSFVVGVLIVSVAAWLPAKRASELNLPMALRTL
jgi:ABC-type antimicrobial peptide transport system permease subunit